MGKIFCLMGKSSSGKDTIFKKLRQNKNLQLKPIVTYTTRPKRSNENDGVEYYFISKKVLDNYNEKGKIIELRQYDTVNGKWYYGTIDDGQINLKSNNYILITTLEAYEKLKKYFGEENVIPLYIHVEDGARLERALRREKGQSKPNYDEMCRRFLADNLDFSEDKLKVNNIKKYNNEDLYICINEIIDNIKSYI